MDALFTVPRTLAVRLLCGAKSMAAGASLSPDKIVVVTGHGADEVARAAQHYDEAVETVVQNPQLGTAHAVAQAAPKLADVAGDAIVLYGDTPFIRPETLAAMLAARAEHGVVVLGFHASDPGRYGRLLTAGDTLLAIREFKDASDE